MQSRGWKGWYHSFGIENSRTDIKYMGRKSGKSLRKVGIRSGRCTSKKVSLAGGR